MDIIYSLLLIVTCFNTLAWCQRHVNCPGGLRVRKEFRSMTMAEWRAFRDACQTLNRNGIWDRFVRDHANAGRIAHGNSAFLPWHRVYLYQLENRLREINPNVTIPYWDWTLDSGDPLGSPLWSSRYLGIDLNDDTCAWPIQTPSRRCLDRAMNTRHPLMPRFIIDRLIRGQGLPENMRGRRNHRQCQGSSSSSFNYFRCQLEIIHGYVHVFVGGDMSRMYSPNDPVFYMHHAFVDKLWHERQVVSGNPQEYGGLSRSGDRRLQPSDPLPPFPAWTVANTFDLGESFCVHYQENRPSLTRVTQPKKNISTMSNQTTRRHGTISMPVALPDSWIDMNGLDKQTVRDLEDDLASVAENEGATVIKTPSSSPPRLSKELYSFTFLASVLLPFVLSIHLL